ncbi:MAG: IS21 family transposase [Candidatus Dormibacteria bacterium]
MAKCDREIMEILEAFDLTRCAWTAAQLSGCDAKTVARYVARREAGQDPLRQAPRPKLVDQFGAKLEEWVERSRGAVRGDVVHQRLRALGYQGDERTTRRAVAQAKSAWGQGHRRTYRPWVPEPGMWLQYDWGKGPAIGERGTALFCAWLAWSRYRVIVPTWDQSLGSLLPALDRALRRFGGCPTYWLTDNAKTVTLDRIAGIPVRHPELVRAARHYGSVVETCVAYDPESKGGSESTVKLAKADLVPTKANLLESYPDFASLVAACQGVEAELNRRVHRELGRVPEEALAEERSHLHRLPAEPYTAALGETRRVNSDQTVRFGSVRYSTPPGHVGEAVWCRLEGEELVVVARTDAGLEEIARHRASTPGRPQILACHYPNHPDGRQSLQPRPRPRTEEEAAFLALGGGAETWLRLAAAQGVARIRTKMAGAVMLAAGIGVEPVAAALERAAVAGRFGERDLVAIVDYHGRDRTQVIAEEAYSVQEGTGSWAGFGR